MSVGNMKGDLEEYLQCIRAKQKGALHLRGFYSKGQQIRMRNTVQQSIQSAIDRSARLISQMCSELRPTTIGSS